ncbi:tetratricopeptide repeat protein [Streptomyces spectabilis]|uniref:tetratricopeptide repeat protein n=1 Tax=Streptomyces spectabilis TaxID=68270 RepID=UPI00298F1A18|nr:tetratricopeptide repeat protein [Streptomyces spectabilis]
MAPSSACTSPTTTPFTPPVSSTALRIPADAGLAGCSPPFERVIETCERVLGSTHPQTPNSRNNLAYAYAEAGNPGRAIPLYEQALEEVERVLGKDHPDTIMIRYNLAGAHQAAGDIRRAIELFARTLQDRKRVLGNHLPTVVISCDNLVAAYKSAGALDRANRLYEKPPRRLREDRERGVVRISSHSTSLDQPTSASLPACAITVSVD